MDNVFDTLVHSDKFTTKEKIRMYESLLKSIEDEIKNSDSYSRIIRLRQLQQEYNIDRLKLVAKLEFEKM